VTVDGLPFASWYTGDDFPDEGIPFHHNPPVAIPQPEESVDVAVVGGGLSGLSTAYLLRRYAPVVLELHDRFGGNAMGESWDGIPLSLGSAYVITPDSWPPDPVELGGRIHDDFWATRASPCIPACCRSSGR